MKVWPKLNTSLVGFVDLLGFKNELLDISSDKGLAELYNKVKQVHAFFDMDPRDDIIRGAHKAVSKRVISLSDAVILTIDFHSPYSKISGILDTLASELSLMGMAQANCVANGIFLRGGLSIGYFFFENDIMLSNAVAESYQMEATATWPVIAMEPNFYSYFIKHEGNECYAEHCAPKNVLFYRFNSPKADVPLYCLDYLRIALSYLQEWHSEEDRLRYIAERDDRKKQQILDESYTRNELTFTQAHKKSIEKELSKDHPEAIKAKYEWLRDYHNEFVHDLGYPESSCIA